MPTDSTSPTVPKTDGIDDGESFPQPQLDERRARVLRAIVEEYVTTAQPVGSQTIATSTELGVSSATVRNDMTVLEREGYLAQPHTSAGRIPTDQGYRFFVDHLAHAPGLPAAQRRTVAGFFTSAHRALEDLLHETSQLLAGLTHHASVVIGPAPSAAEVRTVQLVGLQPGVVLAVAVLANGAVEKSVLELGANATDAELTAAAAALDQQLSGSTLADLPEPGGTGNPVVDEYVQAARNALRTHAADHHDPLYVSGASRIALEQAAFPSEGSAARLLELLEHQVVVVALVRGILDQGITVRIGAENEYEDLRDCSLVLAPYAVEGEIAGTVGVLGPTRMDYQRALAAVSVVSQQLGRSLES
ncbi:MAG TPA: heat-inducible transcriptional repressor HrcA [Acidimicrobiia bacterium]|nr:heat-inducible transcriptional repressor HrcA [Acidimicrobiia bacterium]